jgi:poly-beta-1,6-N-acetyl-D-glucosamine synthase
MSSRYILLTAAKNEETYIGEAIGAVVRQTVPPLAWFIMDDGSSDQTVPIVEKFAAKYPFIHLQSAGSRGGRNFGSQYKAIMAAYDLAKHLSFDFLGVLDADQAPESETYYKTILEDFERSPRLGMASGYLYERSQKGWESRRGNTADAVAGGSAMFRREAFEQIGGYTPLYHGGSDTLAQLEVQRAGWAVLTRPELHIFHYRPTSSAGGIWRGVFRTGMEDGSLGYHPLFELAKCSRRITCRPVLFGSLVRLSGYLWWNLSGRKPAVRPETVAFVRKQQLDKLRQLCRLRHQAAV